MKNITNDTPFTKLMGRTRYTTEKFIDLEDFKEKEILDIGCGYGWFENYIIEKTSPKKIFASEVTEKDLETIRKHLNKPIIENLVSSAIDIKLPNNSIDTVISWEVIEHIPLNGEEKMFDEVGRVLKKGGTFYLSTPYDHMISKFLDPAWWLIGHRHYSRNFFKEICSKKGFEIEKVTTRGHLLSIIHLDNLYVSKWIFRRRPFFEEKLDKKVDNEFMNKENGYSNIFLKMRKIK